MNQAPFHVAAPEIEEALAEKMGQIALKEKEQETQIQASRLGLGYINLLGFPIGPETIAIIPKNEAERLRVVCFLKTANQIRLATTNPTNPEAQHLARTLAEKYRAQVELYVVSDHSFDAALKLYDR